jgi:hypothetical protein
VKNKWGKRYQALCHMSIIPVLGGLRQEDEEFKVSLSYIATP